MDTAAAGSIPPKTRRINGGGLYRCCVHTICNQPADAPEVEGTKIRCIACDAPIVFSGNAWAWDDPDYPPLPPRL